MTEFTPRTTRALRAALKRFGDRIEPDLAFAFGQIGIEFDAAAQERIRGAYSPGAPSARDHLQSRSGALARSGTRHEVRRGDTVDRLSLRIFITKEYGAIHEFGGTIRPKAARALTIPLKDNLDPSGIAILSPREWRATGETFVYNDHRGRGFIVRKTPGSPGDLDFLFMFVDKVVMPPRWGLRKEWRSQRFDRVRGEEIMASLRRASRRAS